jgi:hypothetical protein
LRLYFRSTDHSRQCDRIDEKRHERKNPLAIMWMERFAVMQRTSNEMAPGNLLGVHPASMARDTPMPAFSFEKIAPPVARVSNTPAEEKPRGVIVQILDRFVEVRGKRVAKGERKASVRIKQKP